MKWSNRKKELFSRDYCISARKGGYKATVVYSWRDNYYYYLVEKGDRVFNSLWDKKAYSTEDACKKACEEWIDKN